MRKLALLAVPLVAAGCGSGAVSLGPAPKAKASAKQVQATATPPGHLNRKPLSLEVWFVQGNGLVMRRRAHPRTLAVATAAVNALLAGPTQGERRGSSITTAVPRGTRLIGIGIAKGVATVDLTSQFQAGGGSQSMQLRLAQAVYTLTQFPTVKKVRFELDGAPVNVFSREGIVLDHPVGRGDYGQPDCAGFPASKQGFIAINAPTSGGRVANGSDVRGCSSTFEGALSWDLKAKDGTTVAAGSAHGGSTAPGPFAFSVDSQDAAAGHYVLEVYEQPASGKGPPTSRATVPVVIQESRTPVHQ